jgi:hypothetical protein
MYVMRIKPQVEIYIDRWREMSFTNNAEPKTLYIDIVSTNTLRNVLVIVSGPLNTK